MKTMLTTLLAMPLILGISTACHDGQSATGSVAVSAGGTSVSVGGSVGATQLAVAQWEDLESEKDFWNDVLANPGPWASKYGVTNKQVKGYADAKLKDVWELKDQMIEEQDALGAIGAERSQVRKSAG